FSDEEDGRFTEKSDELQKGKFKLQRRRRPAQPWRSPSSPSPARRFFVSAKTNLVHSSLLRRARKKKKEQ
ncbi:hypothetical protein U1Q18_022018, partial [Sarracenia purpurea var. burkii]